MVPCADPEENAVNFNPILVLFEPSMDRPLCTVYNPDFNPILVLFELCNQSPSQPYPATFQSYLSLIRAVNTGNKKCENQRQFQSYLSLIRAVGPRAHGRARRLYFNPILVLFELINTSDKESH